MCRDAMPEAAPLHDRWPGVAPARARLVPVSFSRCRERPSAKSVAAAEIGGPVVEPPDPMPRRHRFELLARRSCGKTCRLAEEQVSVARRQDLDQQVRCVTG